MDTITQRHTTAATAGAKKPEGVPASVFDVAKPDKTRRKRIAVPDLATVTIRTGVPLPPPSTGSQAGGAYKALLDKMKPGSMVELEKDTAKGLHSYAKKHGIKTATRALDGGRFGVWRL